MIYLRKEGERIRQGLNFYPPSDTGSIGLILRICNTLFTCRYSKVVRKFHANRYTISKYDRLS